MADKTGVMEPSPSSKTSELPSDQGKDSLKTDERGVSWENRAKEFERKFQDASEKMEEFQQAKEELETRLDELNQKVNLTSREGQEKVALRDQIVKLRQAESAQPWLGILNEELTNSSLKTKEQAMFDMSILLMEDFLQDEAEKMGISPDNLEKKLAAYAPVDGKNFWPFQRAKMALKKYVSEKKYLEEKSEFETKQKEEQEFRETGVRSSPSPTQSKLREAKSSLEFENALADL